ncbi:MAG: hypothetical protein E7623_02215 [Ruminococcaceae bacterium]|nr:hypothetical protein [Oscillospiraceae bacterium]
MDNSKKDKNLDDFWDIEDLIPQKKQKPSFATHTYDTEPVEVILKAKESTSYDKLTTIEMRPAEQKESLLTGAIVSDVPPEPDDEYSPENPFIKSVKIYKRSDFGYYKAFYEDGIRYLSFSAETCAEPQYFSYVPQYSQLDRNQLEFYFYMRSELRAHRRIPVSYSYLLLYIFELLGVEPDKKNALSQLSFVWHSYRAVFSKLDALMPEWITDFCFINHLSPNKEELSSAFETALQKATVKELFLCSPDKEGKPVSSAELTPFLLDLCCSYDWKKSKFATGENLTLYEKLIPGAIKTVLSSFDGKEGVFVGTGELKRDAFAGALCTPQNKCRIEVSYCSVARSHEMRFLINDAVKHTENRIRAYIGVKSKLTVYSLPTSVRRCIDEYMDEMLPSKRAPKKEPKQEYDKLYEVPKHEFSLEKAKLIENASWETTQKLVEAFENEEEILVTEIAVPMHMEKEVPDGKSDEELLLEALSPYMEFIIAAISEDALRQDDFARGKGRMTDSVADEINEISADIFGDIILEKNGEAYTVIEDYKEVFNDAR